MTAWPSNPFPPGRPAGAPPRPMGRPMHPRSVDITVSHPRQGCLQLTSRYFFADPRADVCQQFIGRLFEVEEVRAIEVRASGAWAQIEYTNGVVPDREVVAKISRRLVAGANGAPAPSVDASRDLPVAFADA